MNNGRIMNNENSGGKGDWQQEGTPKAVKRQKKPDPSHMIRLTPVADSIFPPIEEFPWSSVMGRFSGLWIDLLATPSHPQKSWTVAASRGFRHHSQRRGRDGFSPSSLRPNTSLSRMCYISQKAFSVNTCISEFSSFSDGLCV